MRRGVTRRQSTPARESDSANVGRQYNLLTLPGQLGDCNRFYNTVAGRPIPKISGLTAQLTCTLRSAQALVTSTSVATLGGLSFTLSGFTNSSEYTGLFDQYRIRQIEVWIEPESANYGEYPNVVTAVDLDDAGTPSFGQVVDKQGSLEGSGAAARYHRWTPHIAVGAYNGSFGGFANLQPQWIDSASPTVQHYGLKYSIDATTAVQKYLVTARALIDFRAPGV